ncbi:MAG: suppressor of fused domain protein [Nannocystaceae bacterium]|nr:suppressor of fused domain protein [Nannocystaceae bacterium]
MSSENYPIAAPGWAAIDAACSRLHPGELPHQFTSQSAYDLDSRHPLPAICVWEAAASPATATVAHWHYVTYGLSELFEKSSPVRDVSGFGFELCFRLPRATVDGVLEPMPPRWPLELLQGIARYVMSGHGELDSGHLVDLGGPLWGSDGGESAIEAVICVPDPQLGKITTPLGSVLFLCLLGLCRDELLAMGGAASPDAQAPAGGHAPDASGAAQGWELSRKIGLCGELAPAAITDMTRASWRSDPRRAATFRRYALGVLI